MSKCFDYFLLNLVCYENTTEKNVLIAQIKRISDRFYRAKSLRIIAIHDSDLLYDFDMVIGHCWFFILRLRWNLCDVIVVPFDYIHDTYMTHDIRNKSAVSCGPIKHLESEYSIRTRA